MKRYLEFINEQVDWNQRLMNYAANGDLNGFKRVIYSGADIHTQNDFPLRWASHNGHLEVVKYLVKKGANIHAINDWALRLASDNGKLEVVEYLCEYIIQNEPWYIPKIIKYIPKELKEKYVDLIKSMLSADDMNLL